MTSDINKVNKYRWLLVMLMTTTLFVSIVISSQPNLKNENTFEHLRVFTTDWGIGATLIALGYPPFAMGDQLAYKTWVNSPEIPSSVLDSGIRSQPNVELLAQIEPNLILDTSYYEGVRRFYDPDIPVTQIDFDIKHNLTEIPKWSQYSHAVNTIGNELGRSQQSQHYIASSRHKILNAGRNIRHHLNTNKVAFISFWDAKEIRMATKNNTVNLAINMMGLELFSLGEASHYGFSAVPIHKLYELPKDTCLIISEPIPELTKYEITHSPIWQRSPFFRPDACVYTIDPVWTRGGINVMVTFAENLEKAVTTQTTNEFSYENIMGNTARAEAAQ